MKFTALGIGATLAGGGAMFFAFGLRSGVGFVLGVLVAEAVRQLRR